MSGKLPAELECVRRYAITHRTRVQGIVPLQQRRGEIVTSVCGEIRPIAAPLNT